MLTVRIHGVAVRVHPLFVLTLGLFWAVGRLAEAVVLFGLVIVHECAHLAAAKAFGIEAREIHLLPVGGVVVVDGISSASPRAEALIAMAGPAVNLALAVPAIILSAAGIASQGLLRWSAYSLVLGLFNLLPALPLDGGRILRAYLTRHLGRGEATKWLRMVGLALLSGLFGAAILQALAGRVNYTLILVALYLLAGQHEDKNPEILNWSRELPIKQRRIESGEKRPIPIRQYVVGPGVPVLRLLRLTRPGKWCRFQVRHLGRSMGEFDEHQAYEALIQIGYHARARDACRQGRNLSPTVESK